MPSGDWEAAEPGFLAFLGACHVRHAQAPGQSALPLDPDIGIAERRSPSHTSISMIVSHLTRHDIVFVFDQSFSRGEPALPQLQAKLLELQHREVRTLDRDVQIRGGEDPPASFHLHGAGMLRETSVTQGAVLAWCSRGTGRLPCQAPHIGRAVHTDLENDRALQATALPYTPANSI